MAPKLQKAASGRRRDAGAAVGSDNVPARAGASPPLGAAGDGGLIADVASLPRGVVRSAKWCTILAHAALQSSLLAACLDDRAWRMLIRALAPAITLAIFRRRRAEGERALLLSKATMVQTPPAVLDLQRSSCVLSKWPAEMVEQVRSQLRPVGLLAAAPFALYGEPNISRQILFVVDGRLMEVPSNADLEQIVQDVQGPGGSSLGRRRAPDMVPSMFAADSATAWESSMMASSTGSYHQGFTSGSSQLEADILSELEAYGPGDCVGDVACLLGIPALRTVRVQSATIGFVISYRAFLDIAATAPPSVRADSVNAAKNKAKASLARRRKPTHATLRCNPLFAKLHPAALTQIQNVMSPQIFTQGECFLRDALHSNKIYVVHSGACRIDPVILLPTATTVLRGKGAGGSPGGGTNCRGSSVVLREGSVIGLSGLIKYEMPSSPIETWPVTAASFTELWFVTLVDLRDVANKQKVAQTMTNTATEILTGVFHHHVEESFSLRPSSQQAEKSRKLSLLLSSPSPQPAHSPAGGAASSVQRNLITQIVSALRECPAFQHTADKILFRVARCMRPKSLLDQDRLATEGLPVKEAFLVFTGRAILSKQDYPDKEVAAGHTAFFSELVAEKNAGNSLICDGSCVVFAANRHEVLDAFSNAGRDFSPMYALIERCEVLVGTKTAKAAERDLVDKTRELARDEDHRRHEALAESRARAAERVAAFQRTHSEALQAAATARAPKLTKTTQERLAHYDSIAEKFHEMHVENRIFASMSNQLQQYARNTDHTDRIKYFSNPLSFYAPATEARDSRPEASSARHEGKQQAVTSHFSLEDGVLVFHAGAGAGNAATTPPPPKRFVTTRAAMTVDGDDDDAGGERETDHTAAAAATAAQARIEAFLGRPFPAAVIETVEHMHCRQVGRDVRLRPSAMPTPALSEVAVVSEAMPPLHGDSETFSPDFSSVMTFPSSLPKIAGSPRQNSPRHGAIPEEFEKGKLERMHLVAMRPGVASNRAALLPPPPPSFPKKDTSSFQRVLERIDHMDWDDRLLKAAARKVQVAPPRLPRSDKAAACDGEELANGTQTDRSVPPVPVFGTSIAYVTNPFHRATLPTEALLHEDGTPRIGRVLPRHLLRSPQHRQWIAPAEAIQEAVIVKRVVAESE